MQQHGQSARKKAKRECLKRRRVQVGKEETEGGKRISVWVQDCSGPITAPVVSRANYRARAWVTLVDLRPGTNQRREINYAATGPVTHVNTVCISVIRGMLGEVSTAPQTNIITHHSSRATYSAEANPDPPSAWSKQGEP